MSKSKQFMSACGSYVTEAHFYRNIARELTAQANALMSKDKTLNAEGKAARLFEAYNVLNKAVKAVETALLSTPEGVNLMQNSALQPEPATAIEKVPHNIKRRQELALIQEAEALAARKALVAETL
jgi:hypothetical protein